MYWVRLFLGPLLAPDGLGPHRESFSLLGAFHHPQQRRIALQRVGYLGMFWSQALLPDCQRAPFGKCWKGRLLPSNIQQNVSNPDLSGCSGWWTKRPALSCKVGEE